MKKNFDIDHNGGYGMSKILGIFYEYTLEPGSNTKQADCFLSREMEN